MSEGGLDDRVAPTHTSVPGPRLPSAVTITLHVGFVVAGMATTLLGPILPALTSAGA